MDTQTHPDVASQPSQTLHQPSSARGEDTRRRLVEHALRLFAENGYASVTTRLIAKSAGVNHAAIGFHFGGKAGLRQAVIQSMVEEFNQPVRTFLASAENYLAQTPQSQPKAAQELLAAAEQFARHSVETQRMRWLSVLFQREQAYNSEGSLKVYELVGLPLLGMLERLGAAGDPGRSGVETKAAAVCVLAQLTVMSRWPLLLDTYLDGQAFEPQTIDTLAKAAAQGVRQLLRL